MSDEKQNTPEDRRTVAATQEHEVRHFIDQYCQEHPTITTDDVEGVIEEAFASIAPSESREKLTAAVENLLSDP